MNDYISTWDSGAPGATWDSGLQWDVNVGLSLGDAGPYLDLVTSEHNQQPKFMRMLANVFQPLADDMLLMRNFDNYFDLDIAVGVQLDTVGLWVGITRYLAVPLEGVYFSLDEVNVGFDEGTWNGPFDPTTGLTRLPDDAYRRVLRAKIGNNTWDGTIPGAYAGWVKLFEGQDNGILIQDLGGMHMLFALYGAIPDAVTVALYSQGYLNYKPAGVKVDAYYVPSVSDTPYFGFDVTTTTISGFDIGAFGVPAS
jgi:hypothetical protein